MDHRQEWAALDDAQQIDCHRYNLAFDELGLGWYWDAKIYAGLQSLREGTNPVRAYVETHLPHLLLAYDPDFLVNAVEVKRQQGAMTA